MTSISKPVYTLDDFDFSLPGELIAQTPAHPRDHARLLVYRRGDNTITDDYFYNLPMYLPAETTLVLNDSKVDKCRLRFGAIEIFVLEGANNTTVRAMVRPGKKFKLGNTVELLTVDAGGPLEATVTAIDDDGLRTIVFSRPLDDPVFDPYRLTPLPPYIAQDERLAEEYQTVYAEPPGSKAAPTAGLHFTSELLQKIAQGHPIAKLTLHVGLGTFAPVKTNTIAEHVMHKEWYEITAKTAQTINEAKHITAVGTTTVRTLESAAAGETAATGMAYKFTPQTSETAIFITPGYDFKAVNAMITNFHLPKTTLLMMVSAFIGGENAVAELQRIYSHAIKQGYRFYSFGDAMLIL